MVERERSRFRFTPAGPNWRDFWFEMPEPFKRLGERVWAVTTVRRIARFCDRVTEGPISFEYPSAGRGYQFLSDEDYSLDDDKKAVALYRIRNGRSTPDESQSDNAS